MRVYRMIWMLGAVAGAAAMVGTSARRLEAQSMTTNPFRPIVSWGELPEGRTWGSTSAVDIAADGNIWMVERCGANTCVGSNVDPVPLFNKEGKLVRSFGSGRFAWPHGIAVDDEGSLYGAEVTQRRVVKWVRFRP